MAQDTHHTKPEENNSPVLVKSRVRIEESWFVHHQDMELLLNLHYNTHMTTPMVVSHHPFQDLHHLIRNLCLDQTSMDVDLIMNGNLCVVRPLNMTVPVLL